MDNILIIQPHSDDAILSCANFIFGKNFKTKVLTIERNLKRLSEDKALSKFIGVKYFNLGCDVTEPNGYSEFFKIYGRNTELNDENVWKFYIDKIGKIKLYELKNALLQKVKKYINNGYIIVCPLGVGHPFHYLIRYFLRDLESSFIFYRDFPHSYKRKAKIQLDEELGKLDLLTTFDDKDINKLKYELAQKFYKTQSGFFFYEHNNIKKLVPEEYYILKSDECVEDKKRRVKIYVISKGRPDGKTFKLLNKGNVEYTAVVEPQDFDIYKSAGHKNILVLPENDRGVSYVTNYVKNLYDGVNPVMIMDDDILSLFYNHAGDKSISLCLKTGDEIHKFFEDLNEDILNTDFDIGTIGKSAFDWGFSDINPRIAYPGSKIRYFSIVVVVIINSKKLLKFDYDETLCLKGDIDFSLKCMYLELKCAKFIRFLQQTKMNKEGKQSGGLSETYKNINKIIDSQERLLKRWPDNLVVSDKKKPINGVKELRTIFKVSDNKPDIVKQLLKKIKDEKD